jgi:hypothetical protein
VRNSAHIFASPCGAARSALLLALSVTLASCDLITGPPPAPVAPSELVAEAVTDVQVGLHWTPPTKDVSAIVVERMVSNGGSFVALATLPATANSYQDSGLVGSTAYRYRMQACGDGGCSPYVEATTTTLAPLALSAAAIPALMVGSPVQAALTVSGGPGSATVTLASGTLPTGLTLSSSGALGGTPTTIGTFNATVKATAANGQAATLALVLTVNRATGPGSFTITTMNITALSPGVAAALAKAKARWEAVIVGDEPDDSVPPAFFAPSDCNGFGSRLNGAHIDDILVVVNIGPIDGAGNVLGQAGPCAYHDEGGLPAIGQLTLDTSDLDPLIGTETLTAIFFHEIGHILGFGTVWTGLVTGGHTDPRFMGGGAVKEFEALGGATGGVLLENQGGEGTARSHWRETTFDSEVMTGFSEQVGVAQPLSRVTIGSMEDIGYTVDYSQADPYTLPAPRIVQGAPQPSLGWDEVTNEPVRVLPR